MKKIKLAEEQVSNDGEYSINMPYTVEAELTGSCPAVFHRWSCDDVAAKAAAAKNSTAKKSDNIESYMYRNEKGEICLPSEYVRQSVINAAKYESDPRSPRKSAADLFRAGLICLNELASLGAKEPDFLDRRRACVQRAGITRIRPAMNTGWKATVLIQALLPEYIGPELLHKVLTNAGRFVGVGDFRPSFGRFQVTKFELLKN